MTTEERHELLKEASEVVKTIATRIHSMADSIVRFKEDVVVTDEILNHCLDVIMPYVGSLVESEDGLGREDWGHLADVQIRVVDDYRARHPECAASPQPRPRAVRGACEHERRVP